MSRTLRWWNKHPQNDERRFGWFDCVVWKADSRQVFGYKKERYIRKELRHSIRCKNRTMFAHDIYEPLLEIRGERFD